MAANTTPQTSVIIPTHNRARLLERALRSVFSQTFQDFEIVVLDDASTDNTESVLAAWRAQDPRVRSMRIENSKHPDISSVLNAGLRGARGVYIARLDDDDWWCHPDKLKLQVEFMEKNQAYVVVGGGVIAVNSQGKELFRYCKHEGDAEIRNHALSANPFSHTTVLFRRDAAVAVGGYGNWRYAEDWDLWLKLGAKGKFYNFQEYFTVYTISGKNKSFMYQREQAKIILAIVKANRAAYPGFYRGYTLQCVQRLYSFLPLALRRALHHTLSYVKRKFF